MQIFDTKLRKKTELKPVDGKRLTVYACGPTVYNFAHIGNLRTYVFEDLLRRVIQLKGYKIHHVMNFTDVDDKTIEGANSEKQTLLDFTAKYKLAFLEDLKTLNIEPVEQTLSCVEHIPQMINLIEKLLKKEVAYLASDGNIFFRISKFPSYGKLSKLCLDDLKTGASNRTSSDEYDKESVSDFVLWKAYDKSRDGNIFWESPWGKGRPGWHIECSAMAMHALGETIDLHLGGVDNIFPHHENEIAQSEACTGKTFARHWMHSSHLIVDGKKMSKSVGNFYTLRDLLAKDYSGREIRYMLMATHYRHQLNFTFEGMQSARNSLRRIDDFIERIKSLNGEDKASIDQPLEVFKKSFESFLFDDLNISGALGLFFDFIREINALCDQGQVGKTSANKILSLMNLLDSVLGVMDKGEVKIPIHLQEVLVKRNLAREQKDWALADKLRSDIDLAGFIIEDLSTGSKLKPK